MCFFIFFIPQALIAELRMLDSMIDKYRNENISLANELANVKKNYISQKKLLR